jgi:hypothetical protein
MNYTVRIEENSHYGDESGRRTFGTYEDAEAALAAREELLTRI